MNDFREFSEAYNDWLAHAGSGRESDRHKQVQKGVHKKGNFLAQYVTDPFWKKEIMGGYVDSEIFDACMRIAQNNNYTDSQKRAMIENKLRPWFSQMGHNDFRDYSDYLEHAYGYARGIDKGELLRQIAIAIKAAKKGVPADKQQQYDQASNQLNQAISDNDRQAAIQAISVIERYGTPGGRNRFWSDVIDSIFKKEEIRANPNAGDFRQRRPKRI